MAFLQWALPRLGMRWKGFRKVRRQVCRRVDRRLRDLGLPDLEAYRAFLERHPEEWAGLDGLCRVTISRFHRDRGVFDALAREVLPALAEAAMDRGARLLRAWSAGCASGEEPYTLALLWRQRLGAGFPDVAIDVVATDADPTMLERARAACYGPGSLKELPEPWRSRAFVQEDDTFCLRSEHRRDVRFLLQDVRTDQPAGPFDLVLCRNLVFTYFAPERQREVLARIVERMRPGGALVVGQHERPPDHPDLSSWLEPYGIRRKLAARSS